MPSPDEALRTYVEVRHEGERTVEPLSGTVTFLFTDIEGSTRLWEEHPQAMSQALARHDTIVSPRTVQTHLTHVYAKLGLTSRVQLAREAARHG
jgi:class 3 adenylate cyclase